MFALLASSLISRVVGGLVTLAVLAGAYFLVIEPAMDTVNTTLEDQRKASEDSGRDRKKEARKRERERKQLTRCLQRAGADPQKIERCTRRFRQ